MQLFCIIVGNATLSHIHSVFQNFNIHLSKLNYLLAFQAGRCYSDLSHVSSSGEVNMVNVGHKSVTNRQAQASAKVVLGEAVFKLLQENQLNKKGDVLATAKIAGILAAKNTHHMIPLCHPIPVTHISIATEFNQSNHSMMLSSTVECNGQTGVEMEALTAVTVAALTIYDMCKSASHDIKITDIRLDRKSGGKSPDYVRP